MTTSSSEVPAKRLEKFGLPLDEKTHAGANATPSGRLMVGSLVSRNDKSLSCEVLENQGGLIKQEYSH